MKRKLAAVLAAILIMNYLAGSPMVAYAYVGDYRSLNEISENESEMSLDEIDELEDETDNPDGLFCEDVELVSEDDASNDVDGENSLTSDSVVSDNEAILNDDSEILTETLISDEENLEDGVEDQAGIETEEAAVEDDEIALALEDDELNEDSSDADDEVDNEVNQIDVEYRVNTKWDNRAVVQVIITNNTDETVHNWGLRFNCNDTFINVYNAEVVKEDDEYLLKSMDYNQDIRPGQSIYLGYTQVFEDEIDVPSDFEIVSVEKITDGSDISALLTINNAWDNYAEAEIILTNNRDTVIKDWKCSFDANFEITSIWDAEIISCSDNSYTIKNADHQQNIYPAESISVGMIIKTDDEPAISNFKIYEIVNNSVSNNSVSDNTVSDNSVSDDTVSENTVSENTVSDNSVSDNTVSDNDIDDVLVSMVDAIKLISEGTGEYISENGYEYDEMEGVSTYIMETYPELVESIAVSSGNTLTINLLSGIFFTYQVSDSSEPLNMSRGGMMAQDSTTSFVYETEDIADAGVYLRGVPTGSSDVLVWAPYDDAWGEYDETDIVSAIMEDADVSQYLTIISNENADVESLKNLGDYGLIVFATHGSEGKWLVTGEVMEANENYLEDVLAGRMCVSSIYDIYTESCDYRWQVSASWLDDNVDELADCIVLNNSCESSFNTDICDVMLSKGARTYFGYNGNVTNQYILFETSDILSQLIYDGTATEDAFTITLDSYFGGGSLEIYGYGNVVMPYGEYWLNGVDDSLYFEDYDIDEIDGYATASLFALSDESVDDSAINDNSVTDIAVNSIPARKFEAAGDFPLVNMLGHLGITGGGYIAYTKEYVPVSDTIVGNIPVRKFETGDTFYLDDNGSFIKFNVPCYVVANEDNYIFVPTDLDYHESVVDAWNANGWWMSYYIQVNNVIGAFGMEVPYAVAGKYSSLFYIPSYPEDLSREDVVANIAGVIAGEYEYYEPMRAPLTNPSFEDGAEGWNIRYNGGEYEYGTLWNVGIYNAFEEILPTDSSYLLELSADADVPSGVCVEQRFGLPADSEKIYFDYNIVEALEDTVVNADSDGNITYSPEFGMHGNIVTFDIKANVNDEWKCVWSDCIDYTNMAELTKVDSYTYEDMYMTGWRTGCVDLSSYSGRNISIRISINGAESMFFDASKLLVDNIRITNSDGNENEIITTYAVISDENSPAYIRSLGIDTEGRSHVFYLPEFENMPKNGEKPAYQASCLRNELMYRHRYQDISQVGFYRITTEDEFFNAWRNMPENPDTKMIDEVVIIMHGKYYALVINRETMQNLTASPDGRVGSDDNALKISELPRRNIETIRINGCNTGLLNAINVDYIEKDNYEINGNVAQAFMNSQNVYNIYAWDGNMNPGTIYSNDRLSNTQGGFHNALDGEESLLVANQIFDIQRTLWIDRTDARENDFRLRVKPMGLVHYVNNNGIQYCTFEYRYDGCSIYGLININTSEYELFIDDENARKEKILQY